MTPALLARMQPNAPVCVSDAIAEAKAKLNARDYTSVSRPFKGTKPETVALVPRIEALAAKRWGVRQIAAELSCSHTTVRKLAKAHGIVIDDARRAGRSRRYEHHHRRSAQ